VLSSLNAYEKVFRILVLARSLYDEIEPADGFIRICDDIPPAEMSTQELKQPADELVAYREREMSCQFNLISGLGILQRTDLDEASKLNRVGSKFAIVSVPFTHVGLSALHRFKTTQIRQQREERLPLLTAHMKGKGGLNPEGIDTPPSSDEEVLL
jgi:hypothetical protein